MEATVAAPLFRAPVRHLPGAAVVDLAGDVDARAERDLDLAYAEATATQPAGQEAPAIVLNFAGVSYINSTGIALLVALLGRARGDYRQVRAFGLSDHYQEIFEITRLIDFMPTYPDERAALAGEVGARPEARL
jgi:anti-anti-sigma factor